MPRIRFVNALLLSYIKCTCVYLLDIKEYRTYNSDSRHIYTTLYKAARYRASSTFLCVSFFSWPNKWKCAISAGVVCCTSISNLRVSFDRGKKNGFLSLSLSPIASTIVFYRQPTEKKRWRFLLLFGLLVVGSLGREICDVDDGVYRNPHPWTEPDRPQTEHSERERMSKNSNNNSLCRERVQWNVELRSHARNRSLLYVVPLLFKNSVFYFISFHLFVSSGCCFFCLFFFGEREGRAIL